MQTHLFISAALVATCSCSAAVPTPPVAPANPDAIIDLTTSEGASKVGAQWRTAPAITTPGTLAFPDSAEHATADLAPKAVGPGSDTSAWTVIEPGAVRQRRGDGRLCAVWYQFTATIPASVGGFDTLGQTVVLETVVDDYAEVWVNGKLPLPIGQSGGTTIAGFNAPSRTVLTEAARPGEAISVAILGINGPISDPPSNRVWIRSATLQFYRQGKLSGVETSPLPVQRFDAAADAVVPQGVVLEKLADGFQFTEGPVWVPARVGGAGLAPIDHGYLLFSDPNANTIYRYDPAAAGNPISVFRPTAGYSGPDVARYKQPGANGNSLDMSGRLTTCEHGNRRVTRTEKNGDITVLADRYQGKRLNSPNDLVYRSDNTLYFTDPPFGLPGAHDDPARELPHFGVYCLRGNDLRLVSGDFTGPNGLAFSPDEKQLYVGDWDDHKKLVMKYEVAPDGALSGGSVFIDLTGEPGEDAIDGIKADTAGNVYVSGPGGLWIVSPGGKPLALLKPAQHPHNFTWGGDDGRTLYLCARSALYRVTLSIPGVRPRITDAR